MRYILTLLLLSVTMFRTAAQENYTLADTLTLDAVVVTGVTLTSMTDEGNLRFNVSKIEGNTGADITNILDRLPGVTASQKQGLTLNGQSAVLYIDGKNSYFNLFPSMNFTHTARNIRQTLYFISAISRPDYDCLYPGMRYDTENSYSIGNPQLNPTRAYSVKYVGYYWTYARFSIGYQRNNDLYTSILQKDDDGLTSYTYLNHADRNMYFAEFTIPFAAFKRKLYGNVEVNVNWSQFVNPRNGYELPYDGKGFWTTKITGFVQYDITDRFSLSSQFAVYPKKKTAQYIEKPYWWLDFSADWYITKKKDLLLSLSVEDVANKLNHTRTYLYSGAERHRYTKSVTQLVRFRLTYKFGGGKKQSMEQKSVANDVGRFRE